MNRKLLDVKETCDYLNLKTSKIYRLTSERQIPFFKIGALLRFDQADLDAWLESQRVEVETNEN